MLPSTVGYNVTVTRLVRILRGPTSSRVAIGLSILAAGASVAVILGWVGLPIGPPRVAMVEAYADKKGGPPVDHSLWNQLVKDVVSAGGWVDYEKLQTESSRLDRYIQSLAGVPYDELGRDEKLALLINAYNAFTIRLILDYYPIKSIKDIPSNKRWKHRRWRVGSQVWSLDDIEHQQIRPHFAEPRIHFALVCAAIGCPPLRTEAFTAGRLEKQLEDQAQYAHTEPRWMRFDPAGNIIHLTRLYNWYAGDFKSASETVIGFAARYVPALQEAMDKGLKPRVKWLDYDWTLNDRKNKL